MNELNNIKSISATNAQISNIAETKQVVEEQIQDNSQVKERDENGPWALWSDLKPSPTKHFCECPTPTESELLTDILIKYGNNPEGIPAIHYAILKNDIKAINLLLKHGASPSTKDSHNRNCLYYSIKIGSIELVKKFVESGANPHEVISDWCVLNLAISSHQNDIAKYLIDCGVKINQKGTDDCLLLCAHSGNLEMYKHLSGLGVVCKDHPQFVWALLNFSTYDYDSFDETIKRQLAQCGKMNMINHVFLNEKLVVEKSVFLNTIKSTCPEALIFLLDNKIIGPNDSIRHGIYNDPILHLSIQNEKHYAEFVKILLERGAKANAKGFMNRNALSEVFNVHLRNREDIEKQKEIIKLLINCGADLNAIDDESETLLDHWPQSPMSEFLISIGARKSGI